MVIYQKLYDVCGQKLVWVVSTIGTTTTPKSERWPKIPCWFDTEWPLNVLTFWNCTELNENGVFHNPTTFKGGNKWICTGVNEITWDDSNPGYLSVLYICAWLTNFNKSGMPTQPANGCLACTRFIKCDWTGLSVGPSTLRSRPSTTGLYSHQLLTSFSHYIHVLLDLNCLFFLCCIIVELICVSIVQFKCVCVNYNYLSSTNYKNKMVISTDWKQIPHTTYKVCG